MRSCLSRISLLLWQALLPWHLLSLLESKCYKLFKALSSPKSAQLRSTEKFLGSSAVHLSIQWAKRSSQLDFWGRVFISWKELLCVIYACYLKKKINWKSYQLIFTYTSFGELLLVLCPWTNFMWCPNLDIWIHIFVPGVGVVPICMNIYSLKLRAFSALFLLCQTLFTFPPLTSFPLVHLLLFL